MARYLLRVISAADLDDAFAVEWFDAKDIGDAIRHVRQVVADMDGPADRYGDLYVPYYINGGHKYYCTVDPDGQFR